MICFYCGLRLDGCEPFLLFVSIVASDWMGVSHAYEMMVF